MLDAARANARDATSFRSLSTEQINWTPDAREWSIGQCFDHMLLSHEPYVLIEGVLRGDRRARPWERMPLLPALFGRLPTLTRRLFA